MIDAPTRPRPERSDVCPPWQSASQPRASRRVCMKGNVIAADEMAMKHESDPRKIPGWVFFCFLSAAEVVAASAEDLVADSATADFALPLCPRVIQRKSTVGMIQPIATASRTGAARSRRGGEGGGGGGGGLDHGQETTAPVNIRPVDIMLAPASSGLPVWRCASWVSLQYGTLPRLVARRSLVAGDVLRKVRVSFVTDVDEIECVCISIHRYLSVMQHRSENCEGGFETGAPRPAEGSRVVRCCNRVTLPGLRKQTKHRLQQRSCTVRSVFTFVYVVRP